MTRGYAVVLTLMVLAAALFAGWYSTTRVIYFPPELRELRNGCERFEGGSLPVLDEDEAARYAGALRAMEEPSLYLAAGARTPATFRLTVEPSFHPTWVVRIDSLPDGSRTITSKLRSYPSSREPMQVRRRLLAPEEIAALDAMIAGTGVLETPLKCVGGVDGARWIVEATDGQGGYTFVHSHSPMAGPVREVGDHLFSLADIRPEYLY